MIMLVPSMEACQAHSNCQLKVQWPIEAAAKEFLPL